MAPSTKSPSSVQGLGMMYCVSNASFRSSVGSLPIGSSPMQPTTFMYLKILRAKTGITLMRALLIPPTAHISVGDFPPSLPLKGVKTSYLKESRSNINYRGPIASPRPIWASLGSNFPVVCISTC